MITINFIITLVISYKAISMALCTFTTLVRTNISTSQHCVHGKFSQDEKLESTQK